jgi:integrase
MKFVEPIRDAEKINLLGEYLWKKSPKWGLYFYLGINTSLRVSDLIKLKKMDLLGSHIEIQEKKTEKTKRILINDSLREKINIYLQSVFLDKAVLPESYLFTYRGNLNHVSRQAASNILSNAAKELGIVKFNNHSLRKTFGYHIYKKTNDLALVMKFLNHSNLSSTLRYLGIAQDQMDQTIKNFNPGDGKNEIH